MRAEIFERSVMMYSVRPSEKYSWSGMPLVAGEEDDDRAVVAGRRFGGGRSRLAIAGRVGGSGRSPDGMNVNLLLDVLQRLPAAIVEAEIEAGADMVAHRRRDRDAAGFRHGLRPCGDIDAVAEDIVVLDDDVAEVDADAKADAPVFRHIVIVPRRAALDVDGAGDRVDDAAEFGEQPIAEQLRSRPRWRAIAGSTRYDDG